MIRTKIPSPFDHYIPILMRKPLTIECEQWLDRELSADDSKLVVEK